MKRFLVASGLLTLGVAATGCGDSDDPKGGGDMDGGQTDAGDKADAKADTGARPDAAVGSIECPAATEACTGTKLLTSEVSACCTDDGQCGLNADDIKEANPKSPFTGCMPKSALGIDSTYCGGFFDLVEPDGDPEDATWMANHTNGGLDLNSPAGTLVFPGCCTPAGQCGALLNVPRGADGNPIRGIDISLGCVGFADLASALGGTGGEAPPPNALPFCNPTTGDLACPSKLGPICDSLKGRGLPIDCTAETDTPSWVCAILELPINGQPAEIGSCFEGLPFAAQGCGAPTAPEGAQCIPGLPADKFGCGARPPAGPVVPNVPKMVCGCGEGTGVTNPSSPCIPNAPSDVCGAADPTPTQLASAPNFLCGCGATVPARAAGQQAKPCLSYLPIDTCGGAPIPPATPDLRLPSALCGCNSATAPGTNVTWNPATMPVPCLSKLPHTSCGSVAATVTDRADPAPDCLAGYAEYQMGCGANIPALTYPPNCIPNAPALYGCVDVTANVAGQPSYLCGCGEGIAPPGNAPCLSNVAQTFCGAVPFTGTAVPIVPDVVCGCDTNPDDTTVVKYTPGGPLCLSTLPTTTCGNRVICTASPFGTQGSCSAGLVCMDLNPPSNTGDVCAQPPPP